VPAQGAVVYGGDAVPAAVPSAAATNGSAPPIRLGVIDDHPVVRDGVTHQLIDCDDIVLVGYAADAAQAGPMCARTRPDVVLLDLRLPDAPAAVVVGSVHRAWPDAKVVIFTAFPDHAAVAPTLAAGACGLIVKSIDAAGLRAAVIHVARDGGPPGQLRTAKLAHRADANVVTPREYDVLRLVAAGYTNPEIGQQLTLSVNTVKAYLTNVMQKLGARNRVETITTARARGLL